MRRALFIAARLALALVFLWAAIAKLRDPWVVFAMELDNMQILPPAAVTLVARTLPCAELVLGILLIAGLKMRYVASLATALLVVFLGMMIMLYLRGFKGDCGCFGPGEQLGPKTLMRDGALVLVSAWVTFEAFKKEAFERRLSKPVATI